MQIKAIVMVQETGPMGQLSHLFAIFEEKKIDRDIPFSDGARGVANEDKFLYPKKSYLAETEPK